VVKVTEVVAAGKAAAAAVSAAGCSPRLELSLSLIPRFSQTVRAEATAVAAAETTRAEPMEEALTEDRAVHQRRMEARVDLAVGAEEAAR